MLRTDGGRGGGGARGAREGDRGGGRAACGSGAERGGRSDQRESRCIAAALPADVVHHQRREELYHHLPAANRHRQALFAALTLYVPSRLIFVV